MQLFSKRNSPYNSEETDIFYDGNIRTMILEQIKYITSSDNFLEKFILLNDEDKGEWRIHKKSLKTFSERELGYDITDYYDPNRNIIVGYNNDYYLFDLIEIIMLFSKNEQREAVRKRFEEIFTENADSYEIYDFAIMKKTPSIKSNYSLIKNKTLKKLIHKNYELIDFQSYQELAKNSADIVQFLLSSDSKTDTKKASEGLIKGIISNLTLDSDSEKQNEIINVMNEIVLKVKFLNNNISNIRHTDQWAAEVNNDLIYKFIYNYNISLVELIILNDPNKYFFELNSEELKEKYFSKYGINKSSGWIIKKPEIVDFDINPDDIPF